MAASSSSFAASGISGAAAGRLKNDDYSAGGGGGGKYRLENDDYRLVRSSNTSDFRGSEPDFRGSAQVAYSVAAAADYRLRDDFRPPDLGPAREPDFGSRTGGAGSGISAGYNPHIWNYGVKRYSWVYGVLFIHTVICFL